MDSPAYLPFHYTIPLSSFLILENFSYNSLSQSPMFPISFSLSSCCFICKNRLWLTFANGFLFHHHQFSSNFFQYSCLYFLSPYLYNNFAMYLPCHELLNLSWIMTRELFFSFLFLFYFYFSIFRMDLYNQGSHMISRIDMSHDYCGKVVHRPSRIDISSVLKSSGNSNEFSLSTLT